MEGGRAKVDEATKTDSALQGAAAVVPPSARGQATTLPIIDEDQFQLGVELARGGRGRIIEALDRRVGRQVALKLPLDPASTRDRARFEREALLASRLEHPAIVPVYEVGRLPTGEPFLAMKLLRGHSLREAIDKRTTLNERLELLPSVLAVADAMAYAHNRHVIHRDLKPSNVLLGEFGETVVIDWGLAKDLAAADDELSDEGGVVAQQSCETGEGMVLGTPAYMPPEQACGQPVDERADVYALGALLYHVIAGAPPYRGANPAEVLAQVLKQSPAPLVEQVPAAPRDLVAIVEKAMQRDPARRYRDARGFANDLHQYHHGQLLTLARGKEGRDPAIEAAFREESRRRAVAPVRVACLVLGAIFAPTFLYTTRGSQELGKAIGHAERQRSELVGVLTVVLILLIGAATYTRLGRRRGDLLGIAFLLVLGCLRTVVETFSAPPPPIAPIAVEAAMGMTVVVQFLIFLAGTTFFRLSPLQVAATFCTLFFWYRAAAIHDGLRFMNENQYDGAFVAAIIIVTAGAWLSNRLRRVEFYGRYRLDEANRRLAEFGRRQA